MLFSDHGARVAIALDSAIDRLNELPTYARPVEIVSVDLLRAFPRLTRLLLGLPLPGLRARRQALSSGTRGTLSWERLVRHRPIGRRHPRPKVHDLAAIQYTNGTGIPGGNWRDLKILNERGGVRRLFSRWSPRRRTERLNKWIRIR